MSNKEFDFPYFSSYNKHLIISAIQDGHPEAYDYAAKRLQMDKDVINALNKTTPRHDYAFEDVLKDAEKRSAYSPASTEPEKTIEKSQVER